MTDKRVYYLFIVLILFQGVLLNALPKDKVSDGAYIFVGRQFSYYKVNCGINRMTGYLKIIIEPNKGYYLKAPGDQAAQIILTKINDRAITPVALRVKKIAQGRPYSRTIKVGHISDEIQSASFVIKLSGCTIDSCAYQEVEADITFSRL